MGAEDLCHQVIFADEASRAVMPPAPEMIQVGERAIWQRPQWRGLVQGAVTERTGWSDSHRELVEGFAEPVTGGGIIRVALDGVQC